MSALAPSRCDIDGSIIGETNLMNAPPIHQQSTEESHVKKLVEAHQQEEGRNSELEARPGQWLSGGGARPTRKWQKPVVVLHQQQTPTMIKPEEESEDNKRGKFARKRSSSSTNSASFVADTATTDNEEAAAAAPKVNHTYDFPGSTWLGRSGTGRGDSFTAPKRVWKPPNQDCRPSSPPKKQQNPSCAAPDVSQLRARFQRNDSYSLTDLTKAAPAAQSQKTNQPEAEAEAQKTTEEEQSKRPCDWLGRVGGTKVWKPAPAVWRPIPNRTEFEEENRPPKFGTQRSFSFTGVRQPVEDAQHPNRPGDLIGAGRSTTEVWKPIPVKPNEESETKREKFARRKSVSLTDVTLLEETDQHPNRPRDWIAGGGRPTTRVWKPIQAPTKPEEEKKPFLFGRQRSSSLTDLRQTDANAKRQDDWLGGRRHTNRVWRPVPVKPKEETKRVTFARRKSISFTDVTQQAEAEDHPNRPGDWKPVQAQTKPEEENKREKFGRQRSSSLTDLRQSVLGEGRPNRPDDWVGRASAAAKVWTPVLAPTNNSVPLRRGGKREKVARQRSSSLTDLRQVPVEDKKESSPARDRPSCPLSDFYTGNKKLGDVLKERALQKQKQSAAVEQQRREPAEPYFEAAKERPQTSLELSTEVSAQPQERKERAQASREPSTEISPLTQEKHEDDPVQKSGLSVSTQKETDRPTSPMSEVLNRKGSLLGVLRARAAQKQNQPSAVDPTHEEKPTAEPYFEAALGQLEEARQLVREGNKPIELSSDDEEPSSGNNGQGLCARKGSLVCIQEPKAERQKQSSPGLTEQKETPQLSLTSAFGQVLAARKLLMEGQHSSDNTEENVVGAKSNSKKKTKESSSVPKELSLRFNSGNKALDGKKKKKTLSIIQPETEAKKTNEERAIKSTKKSSSFRALDIEEEPQNSRKSNMRSSSLSALQCLNPSLSKDGKKSRKNSEKKKRSTNNEDEEKEKSLTKKTSKAAHTRGRLVPNRSSSLSDLMQARPADDDKEDTLHSSSKTAPKSKRKSKATDQRAEDGSEEKVPESPSKQRNSPRRRKVTRQRSSSLSRLPVAPVLSESKDDVVVKSPSKTTKEPIRRKVTRQRSSSLTRVPVTPALSNEVLDSPSKIRKSPRKATRLRSMSHPDLLAVPVLSPSRDDDLVDENNGDCATSRNRKNADLKRRDEMVHHRTLSPDENSSPGISNQGFSLDEDGAQQQQETTKMSRLKGSRSADATQTFPTLHDQPIPSAPVKPQHDPVVVFDEKLTDDGGQEFKDDSSINEEPSEGEGMVTFVQRKFLRRRSSSSLHDLFAFDQSEGREESEGDEEQSDEGRDRAQIGSPSLPDMSSYEEKKALTENDELGPQVQKLSSDKNDSQTTSSPATEVEGELSTSNRVPSEQTQPVNIPDQETPSVLVDAEALQKTNEGSSYLFGAYSTIRVRKDRLLGCYDSEDNESVKDEDLLAHPRIALRRHLNQLSSSPNQAVVVAPQEAERIDASKSERQSKHVNKACLGEDNQVCLQDDKEEKKKRKKNKRTGSSRKLEAEEGSKKHRGRNKSKRTNSCCRLVFEDSSRREDDAVEITQQQRPQHDASSEEKRPAAQLTENVIINVPASAVSAEEHHPEYQASHEDAAVPEISNGASDSFRPITAEEPRHQDRPSDEDSEDSILENSDGASVAFQTGIAQDPDQASREDSKPRSQHLENSEGVSVTSPVQYECSREDDESQLQHFENLEGVSVTSPTVIAQEQHPRDQTSPSRDDDKSRPQHSENLKDISGTVRTRSPSSNDSESNSVASWLDNDSALLPSAENDTEANGDDISKSRPKEHVFIIRNELVTRSDLECNSTLPAPKELDVSSGEHQVTVVSEGSLHKGFDATIYQCELDKQRGEWEERKCERAERLALAKERIRLDKENQRLRRLKNLTRSEKERRELALHWYYRCGFPSREDFKIKILKIPGCGLTNEDIDLLSWCDSGDRVNTKAEEHVKTFCAQDIRQGSKRSLLTKIDD